MNGLTHARPIRTVAGTRCGWSRGQATITPVNNFDPPAAGKGKGVKEISGKFWPDGNRR